MKTITELKQIGQSEKYRLFLDDEYTCDLTLEVIYKNGIRTGQTLDDELFLTIKAQSAKELAFNLATGLITRGSKTKKQIREYLAKKGFDKSAQEFAADKLESYGYINDLAYAKIVVETLKRTKGKNLIKQALYQKGISKENIELALEDFQQNDELLLLAQRYLKNKEKSQENKQKLYRHLVGKGFSYNEVSSVVKKVFEGDEDDWD